MKKQVRTKRQTNGGGKRGEKKEGTRGDELRQDMQEGNNNTTSSQVGDFWCGMQHASQKRGWREVREERKIKREKKQK